jgi:hypothetical protein
MAMWILQASVMGMASRHGWRSSESPAAAQPPRRADLDELRQHVALVLADCEGAACERMRWRVRQASAARDLWQMRCDLFQLVASQHCQAMAARRINALLPRFEGWLPQAMLLPV